MDRRSPMEKSFKDYGSDLLKESTVTGVSSMFTSEGWFRKLVKLLILCFGVAGFLLQTHEFLQLYWKYSTVTSERRMNYMKKPAITICDENLIRRIYLCEYRPDMCPDQVYSEWQFCNYFPPYCLDPKHVYYNMPPMQILHYPENFFDINFTKTSGFQIERSLLKCEWLSKGFSKYKTSGLTTSSCGDPEFVRGITKDQLPGACYTLKQNVDMFDEELPLNSVLRMFVRWNTSDLILTFEPNAKNVTSRFYWITFHDPRHVSNPFKNGLKIQEGKSYKFKVTQVDTIRLPPPYSTKCFDYEKQWKKNPIKGALGREHCRRTCEINAKFEEYGCVPKDVDYPHYKKLCAGSKPFDKDLNVKIQNCMEECRAACKDTHYFTDVKIESEIDYEEGLRNYDSPTVSIIEVFFDSLKSKEIIYLPKYESIELFSYIGGYLGMWLGWSLVAVFDFVEIVLNLFMYPFDLRRSPN